MDRMLIKGWCPSLTRPMLSGDGFLVRIYPALGHLSTTQISGIADSALEFGNGRINLSNRGGLQLRGIAEKDFEDLASAIKKLNLAENDINHSRLICSPFWENRSKYEKVIKSISRVLKRFPELPKKFLISLDLETDSRLHNISADIKIENFEGEKYIVRTNGSSKGLIVTLDQLPNLVCSITEWFLNTFNPVPDGQRLDYYIRDELRMPDFGFKEAKTTLNMKVVPIGNFKGNSVVGIPFGEIKPKTLYEIAKLGSGLRLTPWRSVVLENIVDFKHPELITCADDPLLRISACVGGPSCAQGKVMTRDLAELIAKKVKFATFQEETVVDSEIKIHVSGCLKGCANPGRANITLVGLENGNFDIVLNGTSLDTPEHFNVKRQAILGDINKILGCTDGV